MFEEEIRRLDTVLEEVKQIRRKLNKSREVYDRIFDESLHQCINCEVELKFKGFCSIKCHDEYYDSLKDSLEEEQ